MKSIIFVVLGVCSAALAAQELNCQHGNINIPTEWTYMDDACLNKMTVQIQEELKAAMRYMAMGAYFSTDRVNKLGFADLFFDAASEERQHAIKLISYLLMRGQLTSKVNELIDVDKLTSKKTQWENGLDALKDALNLETSVTKKIRDVIVKCEQSSFNDYHLVDYLTGDFLTEQYHGQRDIAGKISTLEKMKQVHGPLAEFLFDKKLISNDL